MVERTNVQAFVFCKHPFFKVLILKRTPQRSGYWQPVCGGVEKGEEPRDTVKREVFEETGITDIKSIMDLDYTFTYREPKNGLVLDMRDICFAVEVGEALEITLSEEHEEYRWCSYDEAKEYLKWEHNLKALNKLMKLIENK